MPTTRYRFFIADVFTDRAFGGNQLAVLPNATGVTDEQMQKLAREFNFAETAFVLPTITAGASHHLRIFTPTAEVAFAGHPTLGAASVLAFLEHETVGADTRHFVFEEGVGVVSVRTEVTGRGVTARLRLDVHRAQTGRPPDRDMCAAVISADPADVTGAFFASVGLPFCFIHVTGGEVVDRAVLNVGVWSDRFANAWSPNIYVFAGELAPDSRLYARMFAPALGISEDPATGSAAAALAFYLGRFQPVLDGECLWTIDQGVALGRPSLIEARAIRRDGCVVAVEISGQSVVVANGTINVPA